VSTYHVLAFHGPTGIVVVTTEDPKRVTDVSRLYKARNPESRVYVCEEHAEVDEVKDAVVPDADAPPPPGGFPLGMPANPTDRR